MAEATPDAYIPEIHNAIVQRAFWMIGQQLPLEAALESLRNDKDLQSASDDDLIRTIEGADAHWRGQYRDCVRKPGAIEMYAPLMTACCLQRYQNLRELRAVAPEPDKPGLTARMGRLLTANARCALASAESLLLNEKFQQAYEAFGRAEWAARAEPDEGSLRLCEIVWARYGQWVAAGVAGRGEEARSAHQGVGQLLEQAGPAANECLRRVEEIFSRHQWVFQERARLRRELRDAPPRPTPESPAEPSGSGALLRFVNALAQEVQAGRMTHDAALAQARAEFPTLGLQPSLVGTAAGLFESLALTDPERAVLLEEIICELASQFSDQPDVQSGCLYSLGRVQKRLAQKSGAGFESACQSFERAYALVGTSQEQRRRLMAAALCTELAVVSRFLHQAEHLMKWSEEALRRWQQLDGFPRERATAYGLRGEARELAGAVDGALDDHFHALDLFREARSGLDIRRAYHHISDLCLRANRLDEAAAACDEIIGIAQQLGDLEDVESTSLALAQALSRVSRYEAAVGYLDRADKLVLAGLEKNPDDKGLLGHHFQHLMWAARFQLPLFGEPSPLDADERRTSVQRTYDQIERARQIALHLGRDDLLAEAWLQHALLQETLGRLEQAEAMCRAVDGIKDCPPGLRAFRYLLGGRLAASQEEFDRARALLDEGLQALGRDEWDDIRVRYLKIRGHVQEKLGNRDAAIRDYEEAVERTAGFRDLLAEESRIDVFGLAETALDRLFVLNAAPGPFQDTKRALHWAEYSKSRTLAELLGQSQFTLPAPSGEVSALFGEEQELLAAVRSARVKSISGAARITLDESHATQANRARLHDIWDELAARHPEYVELRRGAVSSWDEILQLTEG